MTMLPETTTNLLENFTNPDRYEVPIDLWGPKRDPLIIVVPITVFYSVILVSGVVGNVSTCIVIARNRHMHTATNYYLFSLAVSDFLLLISGLPPEMYHIWSKYPYVFGEEFCILSGFASETSSNATVLTITAFTIERYVAICHPFFSHKVSKLSRAVKFVVAIWLFAVILAVPQAIQMGLVYEINPANGQIISDEYKVCAVKNPIIPYAFEVSTIVFFFVPMVLITVLYALIGIRLHRSSVGSQNNRQQRGQVLGMRDSRRSNGHSKSTRRVVNMLMAVVAAFFICWAPFQAQRLFALYMFDGVNTPPETIMTYKVMTYISGIFYYFSTTVNPLLYNIMSLKFREAFKSTLTRCMSGGSGVSRCELGGSSGGCGGVGGGSLLPGRFNYSVLSHRSNRNSNNNNSCSSGANSYVDTADLTRRPLVVSFKRRSARTSTTSLDYTASPDRRYHQDLLELPRSHYRELNTTPSPLSFELPLHSSPNVFDRISTVSDSPVFVETKLSTPSTTPSLSKPTSPVRYQINGIDNHSISPTPPSVDNNQRIPRIEDIEIFQESQLKIYSEKRSDKFKWKEEKLQSSSLYIGPKKSLTVDDQETSEKLHFVKKSQTAPCLVLNQA